MELFSWIVTGILITVSPTTGQGMLVVRSYLFEKVRLKMNTKITEKVEISEMQLDFTNLSNAGHTISINRKTTGCVVLLNETARILIVPY